MADDRGGAIYNTWGDERSDMWYSNFFDNQHGVVGDDDCRQHCGLVGQHLTQHDPQYEDGDWRLSGGSPLIDAGAPDRDDCGDGRGRSDIGMYGGATGCSWDLDFDGRTAWPGPGPCPGLPYDCDDTDALPELQAAR